ncbi:ABC transporter permease [Desulfotalea psychrophila]|uniref:Transport permease protein n=1 Tax=Desulfotalea psychrophila TaxID=84980 RepID=A0ABS3AWL1_9BACT|nr:ABC transporter permease [Desulfotalea psychrophila]
MLECLMILFRHRVILLATTVNEIKARYKGTVLGLAWMVLYPILFLLLYSVIYLFVFKVRLPAYTPFEYVLLIFAGLVPFLGFAEALGNGVGSVTANSGLVKNTMFPIELIPVKAVLTASLTMIVGIMILLIVLWCRGLFFTTQFLVPVIFLMQIIFTIGLIWILSALNVFMRDLSTMVGVVTLFLMLISPIAYTNEMIPEKLMTLMYANPLYYLITMYREAMIYGLFSRDLFITFALISFLTYCTGFFLFKRLKVVFADYV